MKIINRKIVTISQALNGAREWDSMINLPFQPDQMIIKQIMCNGTAINNATDKTVTLFCRTLNESFGAFYNGGCVSYPNFIFDAVNYPINTAWRFVVRNSDGTTNATYDGNLVLSIEFTKLSN